MFISAENQQWRWNGILLENGDGRWTSPYKWNLPSTTGIIKNVETGMVLGLGLEYPPAAGFRNGINVEEQILDNSTGQMWNISRVDTSDFFTIQNIASGKFLTALAAFDLRVLGT